MDARQNAYEDGKRAYHERTGPLDNPHTPAPPGDPMLAKLWRAGYLAAKRENRGK